MDEFIKTLLVKEKELRQELERTPIFKQWEGVRNTIQLFANGHTAEYLAMDESLIGSKKNKQNDEEGGDPLFAPTVYSEAETWRQKIVFAIRQLKQSGTTDIVTYLKKQGETMDEDKLLKRVGVTVSRLKSDGDIKCKLEGKRGIYSL